MLAFVGIAATAGTAAPAGAVSLTPANTHSWLGPFDMPFAGIESIATSPTGDYVYVGSAGKVIQYTDTGVWVKTWAPYFPSMPGIATDPSGDVYVADGVDGVVQKFDEDGNHIATWSVPGVRQIATDTHGHVFMVASIIFGSVVDVRSYTGTDEGAWSGGLPDRWWHYSGYQPNTTTSVRAIAADSSGNVLLAGISSQRLEGAGPANCIAQFELTPEYGFEFPDPLQTGEVAQFTSSGGAVQHGWLSRSSQACVPGWYSDGTPNGVAVAPDDGSLWVALGDHFLRRMVSSGSSLTNDAELDLPCGECENPPTDNFGTPGPIAFDCHGNLFVGTGDRVLEYRNAYQLTCPQRARRPWEVALAPSLFVTDHKGTPKTLAVDVGCHSRRCALAILVTANPPGCHLSACLATIAHGHFRLTDGRPHTLALALTRRGARLLTHDPLLPLSLGARLLRHGRALGRVFHPLGHVRLMGLATTPITLSCPAHGAVGVPLTVTGVIGMRGVKSISLVSFSPGGVATAYSVPVAAAGQFTLTVVPGGSGVFTFDAHFPGDRTHGPAGAACSSDVPGPPAGPVRRPLPPKQPPVPAPPPVVTVLSLACPAAAGPQEFTGALTPALGEAPIMIVYHYTNVHLEALTLTDEVKTAAAGTYQDKGPLNGVETVHGEATASWPGRTGYAPASSPTCTF